MPTVDISNIDRGIGYTRRADVALREGWAALSDAVAAMMTNLFDAAGGDWVVFFSALDGVDHLNQPAHLVGIWFCGPTEEVTDATWYDASEPFRTGWTFEGRQTLGQGSPVPVLATIDGTPHQIRVPPRPGSPPGVLGVAMDGEGIARLVAVEAEPGAAVADIAAPRPESHSQPTSAHLRALILHSAALAMIDSGQSRPEVMQQLRDMTDPDILGALGTLPGQPSSIASALVPYLRDPAAYLDDEERQVVVKGCLLLLMADGEPTEGGLQVARRIAHSMGLDLPV